MEQFEFQFFLQCVTCGLLASCYIHENIDLVMTRENEGTEREAQGVGRDMLCPRKLFLDEQKSLF